MLRTLALSCRHGDRHGFPPSGICRFQHHILYILTALLTAVTTTGRICTIVSSVLSVVLYNFCFVTPLFSLASYDRSYLVTFGIMFATAMVAGELTARIADNARTSAENAFKTRVLLETNQLLQQAHSAEECARVAMNQLVKLLKLDVVFYPPNTARSTRRSMSPLAPKTDRVAAHRLRARRCNLDLHQQQARGRKHADPA
ncbi:MAG: DUF4118 domain-containing protein [Collinsella sp.]